MSKRHLGEITKHTERFYWRHRIGDIQPDSDGYHTYTVFKVEGLHGPGTASGCSDYAGAIATNMGLWEEYCEFHRKKAS